MNIQVVVYAGEAGRLYGEIPGKKDLKPIDKDGIIRFQGGESNTFPRKTHP